MGTALRKMGEVGTVDTTGEWGRMEEYRAGLFMTGGSQAVRLPAACRFSGTHVRVRKEGNRVILEPIEKPRWPNGFWRWFDRAAPITDDLVAPEPLPASPERDRVLGRMDDDGDR